jgi:hypothetical protein
MSLRRTALLTCTSLMLMGCATYDPLEAERGCSGYAIGTCQTYARCAPTLVESYGSMDGCQAALTDACTYNLQQPDVLGSGAGAAACGTLMTQLDCNDLLNNELPGGCQAPAGRRGDGAACTVGAQCASTRCQRDTPAATSGTCAEPALLAQPCFALTDCAQGLICGTQGRCIALAQAGQACGDTQPCRAPWLCLNGLCAAAPPPPPPKVALDPQVECATFSRTLCARLESCSAFLVIGAYGSQDVCVTRSTRACLDNFALPDTITSAEGLAGCTAALGSLGCGPLLENGWPEACQLAPGARVDGLACSSDAQCASTRCTRATRAARCGVCAPRAQAEQPCLASSDCLLGLVCASDDKCRAPAALGMPCDTTHPCAAPQMCAAGTCQAALANGASCDYANDRCDAYAGLSCDYTTSRCKPWVRSPAGQACGYTSQGWAACSGGATCRYGTQNALCEAPAQDGAACAAQGPACLSPARCVEGVCVLGTLGDCV